MIMPDGKVSRNLAEQVGYLTDEVDELKEAGFVKESDIVNNLESTATDKPLAAAQGKILSDRLNTAISGAMHYKGSVATYADLPTSGMEVGDLYNVIDDDSNYAWTGTSWDAVGSPVDLSNYVDLTSAQNITGAKTIGDGTGTSSPALYFSNQYLTSYIQLAGYAFRFFAPVHLLGGNTTTLSLIPNTTNSSDIGSSSLYYRDAYLSGKLKDGTNSLSIADIAKSTFNVINASDITSNTLTQEQFDIITNGKPTLIKGTFLNYTDIFITTPYISGVNVRCIGFGARIDYSWNSLIELRFSSTTKVVTLYYSIYIGNNGALSINNFGGFNGKSFPAYPSNTGTFTLKCVDGTLTWVAD